MLPAVSLTSVESLNKLSSCSSLTTNMISLYIAKNYNINKMKEFITKELSTSQNIKDKNNRNKVTEALKSIQFQLFGLKQSDHGMAMFVGQCV